MPVMARPSKRFHDTFGDEIANDLVEWFNQVDATYRQELREQNDLNWGRVEARIGQVEARFDGQFAALRADLDLGLERLRSDLLKWMFLYWTGTALTVIGLVIALRK
jgi:hypothetical protein